MLFFLIQPQYIVNLDKTFVEFARVRKQDLLDYGYRTYNNIMEEAGLISTSNKFTSVEDSIIINTNKISATMQTIVSTITSMRLKDPADSQKLLDAVQQLNMLTKIINMVGKETLLTAQDINYLLTLLTY